MISKSPSASGLRQSKMPQIPKNIQTSRNSKDGLENKLKTNGLIRVSQLSIKSEVVKKSKNNNLI